MFCIGIIMKEVIQNSKKLIKKVPFVLTIDCHIQNI